MARPTLGRDPNDATKPLTGKQKMAAVMLAHGKSQRFVAKHRDVNVAVETLRKWLDDPLFEKYLATEQDEFLTDFKRQLSASYIASAAGAVRVLRDQMEEGNEAYVRQGAARIMLDRFHNTLDKEEQKAVEIHFVGMPTLGSPSPDDNVPAPDISTDLNKLLNQ